jgi:hypothetical protein
LFSARSQLYGFCLLACSACADPRGRYEDFVERRELVDAGGSDASNEPCVPPLSGEVEGTALMAIGTSVSPNHPILFFGEITTPEQDGQTTVLFHYHPLDAADRLTELGEELVLGPYPIESDGSFEANTGEMTLPGEANAILPGVPITSILLLHGAICGVRSFYCGTVTGSSSYPVSGPITGDFGLELLEGDIPPQPRFGCAEDQLAVPLD